MTFKLLKIQFRIIFYSLMGRVGKLPDPLSFPITAENVRSVLIFFPLDMDSFHVAVYTFRDFPGGGGAAPKISYMIHEQFRELVPREDEHIIFYRSEELEVTPKNISFDLVVDLNPKFHLELSRFISNINASYKVGFKSPFSDRFYNIQFAVPASGFLERGYKQLAKLIPTI